MPSLRTHTRSAIRNRLLLSIGLFVLFAAASTGLMVVIVASTLSTLSERTRETLALLDAEQRLHIAIHEEAALALDYGLSHSLRTLDRFEDAQAEELEAYVDLARLSPDDPELDAALNRVRELATAWRETWAEPYLLMVEAGTAVSGSVASIQSESLFRPADNAIGQLNAVIAERQATAEASLSDATRSLTTVLLPVGGAAALLSALLGIWLTRSISGPLHRLNRTANAVVAGEAVTFTAEKDDEIGALASVLEQLRGDAARRYDTARVEAETAATFNQLAELTSFAQDEDTLVEAAMRVLARVARSQRGDVMLLNNSTNRLTVAATWGDGEPDVGSPAELDRIDRCPGIRRATAYVAEDLSDELAVRCPAHQAASGSVVCLPMPALGSIVGVIHLERAEARSFDPTTINRAARIAEQVALAIANARLMKTMEGLANTDPLTGLRNARFFDSHLEQELARAERDSTSVGLLMLDVDHFKEFNDTYGHPAGDEALRSLARTLRSIVRAGDVVARYGGEEFIVALGDTPLADARLVAEKLRLGVEQSAFEIGPGRYGRITISVGTVATDAHAVDRKSLVALADAALYRAKEGGRNRVETAPTSTDELSHAVMRRRADLDPPHEDGASPAERAEPLELPPVRRAQRSRARRAAAGGTNGARAK